MDHIENLVEEMTERLLAKSANDTGGGGGGSSGGRSTSSRSSSTRTASTRTGFGGRGEYA